MIVDLDRYPGFVAIRDAEAKLGLTLEVKVSPSQARALADRLEAEGVHTVAADGLRRAADDAEKRR